MGADSLADTLVDSGDLMPDVVDSSTNAASQDRDSAGNVTSPSLWDNIKSGISDLAPTLVAGIKTTGTGLVSESLNAAKGKILGQAARKIAARPDEKQAAKTATGNTIGAWVVTYWKELALVGLVVLFFVVRKFEK